jgi:hypothetical protein
VGSLHGRRCFITSGPPECREEPGPPLGGPLWREGVLRRGSGSGTLDLLRLLSCVAAWALVGCNRVVRPNTRGVKITKS